MQGSPQRPDYEAVDMTIFGPDAPARAFANQVAYCARNGAPLTGRVLAAIGALLAAGEPGALFDRVRHWPGAPLADAMPLRVTGGLHALYLAGDAPELGAIYRGEDADDAALIARVIARHEAALMPWLDGPPQTNEAGRSANFIAAMLWLAEQGCPARFQCLEIGSSAGINLMLDRYAYDLGGVKVGPQASAVMQLAPDWRGPAPPDRAITIAATKGCDVAPVDLTDPAQALRLKAYVWPEHAVRFDRLDAAIRAAHAQKPDLVRMNAADFVEAELARPQAPGTTRVLMHSIVWQYVPADQQTRVTAAMAAAGARATPERPLAWIHVEADRSVHRHKLTARYWPGGGGGETHLAWSHPHGVDVEWLG